MRSDVFSIWQLNTWLLLWHVYKTDCQVESIIIRHYHHGIVCEGILNLFKSLRSHHTCTASPSSARPCSPCSSTPLLFHHLPALFQVFLHSSPSPVCLSLAPPAPHPLVSLACALVSVKSSVVLPTSWCSLCCLCFDQLCFIIGQNNLIRLFFSLRQSECAIITVTPFLIWTSDAPPTHTHTHTHTLKFGWIKPNAHCFLVPDVLAHSQQLKQICLKGFYSLDSTRDPVSTPLFHSLRHTGCCFKAKVMILIYEIHCYSYAATLA